MRDVQKLWRVMLRHDRKYADETKLVPPCVV